MRQWKRKLKKLSERMFGKGRRKLEKLKQKRREKKESYERNLRQLKNLIMQKGIRLSHSNEYFLDRLSASALNSIFVELKDISSKQTFEWGLEGCISYFRRVVEGERPKPIPGSGPSALSGYLIDFVARKKRGLQD